MLIMISWKEKLDRYVLFAVCWYYVPLIVRTVVTCGLQTKQINAENDFLIFVLIFFPVFSVSGLVYCKNVVHCPLLFLLRF